MNTSQQPKRRKIDESLPPLEMLASAAGKAKPTPISFREAIEKQYMIWVREKNIYIMVCGVVYIFNKNEFITYQEPIELQKNHDCVFVHMNERIIVKITNAGNPTRTFYDKKNFGIIQGKIIHGIGFINYYNGPLAFISNFTTSEAKALGVEFDSIEKNTKYRHVVDNQFLHGPYTVKIIGSFGYNGTMLKIKTDIKISRKHPECDKLVEITTNDFETMNKWLTMT